MIDMITVFNRCSPLGSTDACRVIRFQPNGLSSLGAIVSKVLTGSRVMSFCLDVPSGRMKDISR